MTKRVSVTEIHTYQECPRRHHYKHTRRIQPILDKTDRGPMSTGIAVHRGIEIGLLARDRRPAVDAAMETLKEVHGNGYERYEKGVRTCLEGVPDWIWDAPRPVAEIKYQHLYAIEGDEITITGKPDLWYLDTDSGSIKMWDFKTTSKNEKDRLEQYNQWSDQPRFYAVLLHDELLAQGLEVPPIYTGHLVLSTRGKHAIRPGRILNPRMLEVTRSRMLEHAALVGTQKTMHIGFQCMRCEFAMIDEFEINLGNAEAVIEHSYRTRERRES